jgi:predicted CoA-binding protein
MGKLTLVAGASTDPSRYSFKAAHLLKQFGHPVYLVGRTPGKVAGEPIHTSWPEQLEGLDTLTLYLNPVHQAIVADKIIALKPKRIIFNPGAENDELAFKAQCEGIEVEYACTLVMLNTGQY